MTPKAVLWQRWGAYEWSSTYYSDSASNFTVGNLADILDGHALFQCDDVTYDRWEIYDIAGGLIETVGPTIAGGQQSGEMQPIKYALLIRLNSSPSVQRPSTKYIHGYSEAWTINGVASSSLISSVNIYGAALAGASVTDSEGAPVTGATFRSFTRRKKMRRQP